MNLKQFNKVATFKTVVVCFLFLAVALGAAILTLNVMGVPCERYPAIGPPFGNIGPILLCCPFCPFVSEWIDDFWRANRFKPHLSQIRLATTVVLVMVINLAAIFGYRTGAYEEYLSYGFTGYFDLAIQLGFHYLIILFPVRFMLCTPPDKLTPEEAKIAELRSTIESKQRIVRQAEQQILEQQQIILRANEDIVMLKQELQQILDTDVRL